MIWNHIARIEEALEGLKEYLREEGNTDEPMPGLQRRHILGDPPGRNEDPARCTRGESEGAEPLSSDGELDAADDRAGPGGVRDHGAGGPPDDLPAATPVLTDYPIDAQHLAGATVVEVTSGGWSGERGEIVKIEETQFGVAYVTVAVKVRGEGGVEHARFRARLLQAAG